MTVHLEKWEEEVCIKHETCIICSLGGKSSEDLEKAMDIDGRAIIFRVVKEQRRWHVVNNFIDGVAHWLFFSTVTVK